MKSWPEYQWEMDKLWRRMEPRKLGLVLSSSKMELMWNVSLRSRKWSEASSNWLEGSVQVATIELTHVTCDVWHFQHT